MEIILLLAIIIGLVIWAIKVYNRLQTSMQAIREMFSNLQASLKKRSQLGGQIIEIASGYMEHEQLTQLKISQGQANAGQIQMLAQDFPELRADRTYQKLMQQLENLENDILARREKYNNRVNSYNSYRNSFPAVLIAQKLSFDIVDYFDTDDEKFDMQTQQFVRDDSEGLKQLIGDGKKAVEDAAGKAVKKINEGVAQIKDKLDQLEQAERTAAQGPGNSGNNSPQENKNGVTENNKPQNNDDNKVDM